MNPGAARPPGPLPQLAAHIAAFALSTVGSLFLTCRFTYRVRPTWRAFFLFPLSTAPPTS
ncbi:hypothetical protein [Streptomyces sp. NBRC 110028]|uniref:hypothetical protein n=1 Tax=Streptomyces sp. NBRC 110028 TaxID=1621260 RepID=UPI000AFDA990